MGATLDPDDAAVRPGPRLCGSCGRALADDWPSACCPACLLGGEEADADGDAGGLASPGRLWRICRDFDRYEFIDDGPIQQGGQGEIHRVHDRHLRRIVALKRLSASGGGSGAAKARFVSEATIAGRMQHPGFLPILDAGEDPEGRLFYTTHLLTGRSFEDLVAALHAKGPPDDGALDRALDSFRLLCGIVAYAHSRGVAHRDLKPNNVLFGNFDEVFLIDLGAATWTGEASSGPETGISETPDHESGTQDPGVPLGMTRRSGRPYHPLFTPPEVLRRDSDESGYLTDVYALGVFLYYIACGRLPYVGGDEAAPEAADLVNRVLERRPEPVGTRGVRVPRALAAIVGKAMARDPAQRYQSVPDLSADLDRFRRGYPVVAEPPRWTDRLVKWTGRHARPLGIGAMVAAALGITGTVAWSYKQRNDIQRQVGHLRDARIAARNGQWSLVLSNLDAAARSGYADGVDLGMQRYTARVALADPHSARVELERLAAIPDLGTNRGAVLLRRGEHDLFSPNTYEAGMLRVREAIDAGLGPADRLVAEGMLAATTTEALDRFEAALRHDPYHHPAHAASLGLEFLLGRRDRLRTHIELFEVLYPQDPSGAYLQAFSLASEGRLEEALAIADRLGDRASPESLVAFRSGIRVMSGGSRLFTLEAFLRRDESAGSETNQVLADVTEFFRLFQEKQTADATNAAGVRLPQLPCIKAGIEQGKKALLGMLLASFENSEIPLRALREAVAVHPEGGLALFAATLREQRFGREHSKEAGYVRAQADLFQTAADLPSILPGIPALARFLAASHQRDLVRHPADPEPEAATACRNNLEWFIRNAQKGAASNQALFRLAADIRALDLARVFLGRWEAADPGDQEALLGRIRLEIDCEAYPAAARAIDQYAFRDPANPEVTRLRQQVAEALERLRE
ncbi:MAG: serine/threonine protein kinase [Limisphaerales bacterium]